MKQCKVNDCDLKHVAKGFCQKHYDQVKDHGRVLSAETQCQMCGAYFENTSIRKVYCSRACKRAAWNKRNPERLEVFRETAKEKYQLSRIQLSHVWFGSCSLCGRAIAGKGKKQNKRLCVECVSNASGSIGTTKACRQCGLDYVVSNRFQYFCSDQCRSTSNAKSRRKSKKAMRRKYGNKWKLIAKARGVAYEPVNVMRVFERDGWACQICGKDTPSCHRGTQRGNAPELDHRIPISRGGPHTYANVQCACRECNQAKGNRIPLDQSYPFNNKYNHMGGGDQCLQLPER